MDAAGIATSECVAWNACPWFVHGLGGMKPAAQDRYLIEGTLPLLNVITRLPRLRAVFVFGGATDRAWKTIFGGEYPRIRRSLDYFYHRSTGPVGYRGSRTEQAAWRIDLSTKMDRARTALDRAAERDGFTVRDRRMHERHAGGADTTGTQSI